LISLVLVLFFGEENQGARRWFMGGSIQPGEVAKLLTVVYIAAWVTSKGTKLRKITYGLIPFGILVGLVTGLIAMEPNYSTAILIGLTAFAMFFIAGADLLQFALSVLIGGVTAAGLISRSPRALDRILLMMSDPFKLPVDQAWQLTQSLIALASGGVFGKGLGTGGGQYGYVPLAHSDGIFAIWGEETGLIGTWLLVGLVLFLAYRGFRVASKAPDDFGRVLASGVTLWLTLQAFVNIGVVTQLIPFTGQPLPFISYGGSALVTALAGIGLLLSVSRGKAAPVVVKSAPRAPAAPPLIEKEKDASVDYGWGNRRPRVSTVSRSTKPRRRPRSRPRK
jgi:cell division protein FtsW